MPNYNGRTAQLEAEILHGLSVHDAAAKVEATAFRALQKAAKEGTPGALEAAVLVHRRAHLRAHSHRKAIAALTDDLGYVPARTSKRN